ncbi:MAG: flagellar hook-length control protein FliK [Lysobacterales bacterium]
MSETINPLPFALPDSPQLQPGQNLQSGQNPANNDSANPSIAFQSELEQQLAQSDPWNMAGPIQGQFAETTLDQSLIPEIGSTTRVSSLLEASIKQPSAILSGPAGNAVGGPLAHTGATTESLNGQIAAPMGETFVLQNAAGRQTPTAEQTAASMASLPDADNPTTATENQQRITEALTLERSMARSPSVAQQALSTLTTTSPGTGSAIAAALGQATVTSGVATAATAKGFSTAQGLDESTPFLPNSTDDADSVMAPDSRTQSSQNLALMMGQQQVAGAQGLFGSANAMSAQFTSTPEGFGDTLTQGQLMSAQSSSVGAATSVSQSSGLVSASPEAHQASPASLLSTERTALPGPATGQVSDQVKMMIRSDQREARLQLHPRELGAVNIRIALHADQADVAIEASNPELYRELSSAIPKLRQLFLSEGVGLNQLALDLGQSSQQQTDPQQNPNAARSGARDANTADSNPQLNLLTAATAAARSLPEGQTLSLYA